MNYSGKPSNIQVLNNLKSKPKLYNHNHIIINKENKNSSFLQYIQSKLAHKMKENKKSQSISLVFKKGNNSINSSQLFTFKKIYPLHPIKSRIQKQIQRYNIRNNKSSNTMYLSKPNSTFHSSVPSPKKHMKNRSLLDLNNFSTKINCNSDEQEINDDVQKDLKVLIFLLNCRIMRIFYINYIQKIQKLLILNYLKFLRTLWEVKIKILIII